MVVVGNAGRPRRRAWSAALRVAGVPAGVGRPEGGDPGPHGRVDTGPGPGAPIDRRSAGRELSGHRVAAVGEAAGQHRDLVELLLGEGEPGPQLRVEGGLRGGAHGHVLEGARGGDHDLVVVQSGEVLEETEGVGEVVGPHVATVHHPGEQHLVAEPTRRLDGPDVGGPGAEVEPDPVDGGVEQHAESVAGVVEECRHAHRRRAGHGSQPVVGVAQGVELGGPPVGGEGRLVEADPRRAPGTQFGEQLLVDVHQCGEERQGIERVAVRGGVGQQQERDRAEQARHGGPLGGAGLGQLVDHLRGVEVKSGVAADLGHQMVVVRVEPLGHGQRGQVDSAGLHAPGHGEVAGQGVVGDGVAVARGDRAHEDRGVEHVVVEREVVGGEEIDPGLDQPVEVGGPDLPGHAEQAVGVETSGPEPLDGPLQLAAGPDPGQTVDGGSRSGRRTSRGPPSR